MATSALALVVVVAVIRDSLLAKVAVVARLAHTLTAAHRRGPALRVSLAFLSRNVGIVQGTG